MLREKRLMQIMDLIKRDGQVEISNLCRMFNVTDMTIRRDLDNLARENNIIRTHGGAMRASDESLVEPSIDRRMIINSEIKERISKKALELIQPGNKVFIDSGTTTWYMALHMPNEFQNIVITNGINIATEVISRPHIDTLLIGGELRRNTQSCRGALAEEQLARFKVDLAFIGTNAIGNDGYLYLGNAIETGFKKQVMRCAQKTILLADSSKFNTFNLISYAHVSQMDCILTDSKLPKKIREDLENMGAHFMMVD
ncbi:DeoR/GlpR family DNA-binding transcription regulator [Oscillospiraceae bacterium PP1C4]